MTRFQKLARSWRTTALIVFNALVLFVLINLVLFAEQRIRWSIKGKSHNPLIDRYGIRTMEAAYPGMPEPEVRRLLDESWKRGFVFEPFVMFQEAPFQGRYVNVATNGFRRVPNQGPWPPAKENFNIFVFGGSTMFGYGVADDQTVPARLQERLRAAGSPRPICVYNLGCAYYYSTQERILFAQLLLRHIKPEVAVFVDGLNDSFWELPGFSDRFAMVMQHDEIPGRPLGVLSDLPLMKKAAKLQQSLAKRLGRRPKDRSGANADVPVAELARQHLERYLGNRAMIQTLADAAQVKTLFVWQPVPHYHYDLSKHPFIKDPNSGEVTKLSYAQFAELLKTNPLPENFVWTAESHTPLTGKAYVDYTHYGPEMSDTLAELVAQSLRQRGYVP